VHHRQARAQVAIGRRQRRALLGVVAIRTGKKIAWDYENMKAIGVPEADAIINGEPYREGWELE